MGCTRQTTCCCWRNSYFNPGERGQSNMSSLYPLILKQSLQIITGFTDTLRVDVRAQRARRSSPLSPSTEWAVLHSTASIIHQAAENIIHIHKFSQRELWSRWYKRLYGSDHISHSGLINSWKASQMLLAALHMLQLPLTGQSKIIITSNIVIITVCAHVTAASEWAEREKKKNNIK